jgi:hypothetical protein
MVANIEISDSKIRENGLCSTGIDTKDLRGILMNNLDINASDLKDFVDEFLRKEVPWTRWTRAGRHSEGHQGGSQRGERRCQGLLKSRVS